MLDLIVIGSGPAGVSAAITARARGKSVLIISNPAADSGLYKAPVVDNYPGLPGISGAELCNRLTAHAESLGAKLRMGRVTSILPMGETFSVAFSNDFATARAVILALGTVQTKVFDGEAELLGRGVSYCATCDGMLYRQRKVVVAALAPDAHAEAEHLRKIGCEVTEITPKSARILGTDHVVGIEADGETLDCDAIFILRQSIAPSALLAGMDVRDGHLVVDSHYRVSVNGTFTPGIYAAGDCIGKPHQIAKAIGEGQTATFSAMEFADKGENT